MTLFHAIRRRYQINRAIRELTMLDNDILQDIGIDRAHITDVVENMIDLRTAQSMGVKPASTGYATPNYTAAGARLFINQNLEPTVTLSVDNGSIAEADGTATVTATLSATHTESVTVDLEVTGTATLTDDYTVSGTQVVIPAGTVLVLDVKTGGIKANAQGAPRYFDGYALQCLAYADSVPVTINPDDADDVTWGEWDQPPSMEHALIAHIDLAEGLETGSIPVRLIHVDLVRALNLADTFLAVKQSRKQKLFSAVGVPDIVEDFDLEPRIGTVDGRRVVRIGRVPDLA